MDVTMTREGSSSPRKWVSKKKAGTEVWFGVKPQDLPYKNLGILDPELFVSYSGPDNGLVMIHELEKKLHDDPLNVKGDSVRIAGAKRWNLKNRKCYGICMSLYDQHPITKTISGDPVADSFGICARKNNAVLVVADGVNWGEKSRRAARCAVYGAMTHINAQLYATHNKRVKNTHEVFTLLLETLRASHRMILRHDGGLTTLCVALVLPTRSLRQYVVCIANVGDSLAYVYSKFHGIREITTGSHDIRSERDIRDAGGALGPVHGAEPELHNMTLSMTFVDRGDIVYLTTDGISDNFDPVVTKIAVAKKRPTKKVHDDDDCDDPVVVPMASTEETSLGSQATDNQSTTSNTAISQNGDSTVRENGNQSSHITQKVDPLNNQLNTHTSNCTSANANNQYSQQHNSVSKQSSDTSVDILSDSGGWGECGVQDGKPEMEPHERHRYAVREMERVLLEFELYTEQMCCAQELCGGLLQHVLKLTNAKRSVLEDPDLYGRRLKRRDKERRDSRICQQMSVAPGKLDHATVVAYEVGCFRGDEDEDYEASDPEAEVVGSDTGSSLSSLAASPMTQRAGAHSTQLTTSPIHNPTMDIPFIDDSDQSDC